MGWTELVPLALAIHVMSFAVVLDRMPSDSATRYDHHSYDRVGYDQSGFHFLAR